MNAPTSPHRTAGFQPATVIDLAVMAKVERECRLEAGGPLASLSE